ncbi:cilia- and flagella-associated protein 36-like [Tachysurus fulvidraco]|uniref:cilia- and flagella-associated protein 36-like n=1 Tax=Tachysurus fulvidraco TaxID=1234273 RepID=UPI001FEDB361|nr:cilia- and flagella-associated protein 36-like [Tachysurus fulvidraco]
MTRTGGAEMRNPPGGPQALQRGVGRRSLADKHLARRWVNVHRPMRKQANGRPGRRHTRSANQHPGQGCESFKLDRKRGRAAGISKPFQELTVAQQEQLQQRAEYLRQQRDKLQALRKEQKGKSVNVEETPSPTPTPTPTTAPHTQEISVEEKKKLQKRKHLAEKLKEEVIKK